MKTSDLDGHIVEAAHARGAPIHVDALSDDALGDDALGEVTSIDRCAPRLAKARTKIASHPRIRHARLMVADAMTFAGARFACAVALLPLVADPEQLPSEIYNPGLFRTNRNITSGVNRHRAVTIHC
jgi:hypothetical protein